MPRMNKECFEKELATTWEWKLQKGFPTTLTQFGIFLLSMDFSRCPHLSRCSLLHAPWVVEGTETPRRVKTRMFFWLFSPGISGVSTSTMVFNIQPLTRRIGLTSAIKQFLYGVMDMSTHLEIFQQESYYILYYMGMCRLPSFRPGHLAPCSLLREATGHGAQFRREWVDKKRAHLTHMSIVHPFVDHFFRESEDEPPSRMDHPLQSGFFTLLRIEIF